METFAEHSTAIDEEIADSKFLTLAKSEAEQELRDFYLERVGTSQAERIGFEKSLMVKKYISYNEERINERAVEIAGFLTGFTADTVAQIACFNCIDTLVQLNGEWEDEIIDEMMKIVNVVEPKLLVVLFRDEGSILSNLRLCTELRDAKLKADPDLIVEVLSSAKALRAVDKLDLAQ